MSLITILSGSARKNGNTELLVQAFSSGAAVNNTVEIISIADYQVNPCTGCNYCNTSKEHQCCIKDDMDIVYEKLRNTDILVIASPVYFYGISAGCKAIIDRLHNPIRNTFHIKKAGLLSVGADTSPELFDSILMQDRQSLRYFDIEDLGTVLVYGVKNKGDIKDNPALEEAYQLGLSIR